jgi:hypothetical protein
MEDNKLYTVYLRLDKSSFSDLKYGKRYFCVVAYYVDGQFQPCFLHVNVHCIYDNTFKMMIYWVSSIPQKYLFPYLRSENELLSNRRYTELFYVFLKLLRFYPMEIGVLHLMEEITWKHETRQSQQYGDTCTPLTFMLMEKYMSVALDDKKIIQSIQYVKNVTWCNLICLKCNCIV